MPNIAINHRAFGTGLKTATRFFAGYGRRYVSKLPTKSRHSIIP